MIFECYKYVFFCVQHECRLLIEWCVIVMCRVAGKIVTRLMETKKIKRNSAIYGAKLVALFIFHVQQMQSIATRKETVDIVSIAVLIS